MKKIFILFFQILAACCCFGQSIDSSALRILQKSYDRLSAMENVAYRINTVDTMLRENQLNVRWYTVHGTIKKNAYWHLRLDNNAEWLVRGDTLYKKEDTDVKPISFTTDWDRHKLSSFSVYSILGTKRPTLDKDITSLQFVQDTSRGELYVIDVIRKKIYAGTDEIQSKLYFNRYWVNRKSFLATRRMMYAKSLEKGKEAVDIYDFSVAMDDGAIPFNPAVFFHTSPVKEANRFETLKIGAIAPLFTATDVRTGNAVSLEKLKGKVVLLDFWYLSCSPCRMLMPKLQKLQEKFKNENVVVIGINIRDTAPKEIIRFLNEKQLLYPQYYKTGQLLAWDYKLKAFPTTIVLGKDGKVKLVETGVAENTEQTLEQAIRKELNFHGQTKL